MLNKFGMEMKVVKVNRIQIFDDELTELINNMVKELTGLNLKHVFDFSYEYREVYIKFMLDDLKEEELEIIKEKFPNAQEDDVCDEYFIDISYDFCLNVFGTNKVNVDWESNGNSGIIYSFVF